MLNTDFIHLKGFDPVVLRNNFDNALRLLTV